MEKFKIFVRFGDIVELIGDAVVLSAASRMISL